MDGHWIFSWLLTEFCRVIDALVPTAEIPAEEDCLEIVTVTCKVKMETPKLECLIIAVTGWCRNEPLSRVKLFYTIADVLRYWYVSEYKNSGSGGSALDLEYSSLLREEMRVLRSLVSLFICLLGNETRCIWRRLWGFYLSGGVVKRWGWWSDTVFMLLLLLLLLLWRLGFFT